MNFIVIIFASLATIISAANLRGIGKPKAVAVQGVSDFITATYRCPSSYHVNQINENVGAIVDRINLRCNDPNYSQFSDLGTGIGYVTSPKAATIRLPAGAKGWDSVQVGYALYAPKDQWVVAAVRFCTGSLCYESFFYGLTICSADDTKEYKCGKIEKFDETSSGKMLNGVTATYNSDKFTGFVKSFTPLFV